MAALHARHGTVRQQQGFRLPLPSPQPPATFGAASVPGILRVRLGLLPLVVCTLH